MTTLNEILDGLGFAPRREQESLYEELRRVTPAATVVQAGTGTGKSIGVLAAAVDWARFTQKTVAVVTPTKFLMDQYIRSDGPAVEKITGISVRILKGRRNYLCSHSKGFRDNSYEWRELINRVGEEDPVEVPSTSPIGCHGRHRKSEDSVCAGAVCWQGNPYQHAYKCLGCHAKMARARIMVLGPQIAITNMHVLATNMLYTQMLPELGALFVDEAHRIEDVLRDFFNLTLSYYRLSRVKEDQAAPLRSILERLQKTNKSATRLKPDSELVRAIRSVATASYIIEGTDDDDVDEGPIATAQRIVANGEHGSYRDGFDILHFEPGDPKGNPPNPRLISTGINLAGPASALFSSQPTGLVSATIPQSLRSTLGLNNSRFVDVGHPFDYGKQATISFSDLSGAWRAAKDDTNNFNTRCKEVYEAIQEHAADGGALLLFSAFRDLRQVYDRLMPQLARDGRMVLRQDNESDNPFLMRQFKQDGRAVLFGSETFSAGMDIPGDALRLVVIWKLPYPGVDPVTEAIKESSYRRYEDLMLVKVVQGSGRLIRTTSDTGHLLICDSRGRNKLLNSRDPMVRHLSTFRLLR